MAGFGGFYQGPNPGPKKIPVGCVHANQHYVRSLPRGSGQWVCSCGATRSPMLDQEGATWGLKPTEIKRLHFLRYLFSDQGPHGSALRYSRLAEEASACIWPRTCYDDPWLDSSRD